MRSATRWPPSIRPMPCWPRTPAASRVRSSSRAWWPPMCSGSSASSRMCWRVAPGAVPTPTPVDASTLVNETCLDWARTNQLAPGPLDPLSCVVPLQPLVVSFDPEHLRRVLVNLLDNALRHADPGPASVQVLLEEEAAASGPGWARLVIFQRRPADRARGGTASVRALLLHAQPRLGPGLVHLPGAVRTLRRPHRCAAPP